MSNLKLIAAASPNSGTIDIASQVKGFFGFTCIADFVMRIVDVAIIGGSILLLAFLVWGGLEWLMAGSDKGKVESARNRLVNALIGLTIIVVSYAVWRVVLYFFGISAPNICAAENPF